ncbi:linker for activation of T-cells family member 1 isoform X2 [Dasypus novemcinctus]|uniref:linker for activation of T-cells family member 1 isoform X2 n=1 Tax=Dasypus novemcinctus TaxID=9361 RepID=UPI00265FDA1A|nr:linker for activation of T-cells family member 1 isoform X2 [Dasypus novemcinctus]
MISCPHPALTAASCHRRVGAEERRARAEGQMEAAILVPAVLGLLLLPVLAVLLTALCLRCRELPSSYDSASSDSLYPSNMLIKRPHTLAPWPPVTSYPPLSQPDLLPIPRSPQPPGGAHRVPSSQQDTNSANSVASYENEELACEDADEDEEEEDYHNEGYLEVLPDSTPAPGTALPPPSAPVNPGLRDSTFSVELGEDYVNVPESEESAEASLDGSREYVNVSEELQPTNRTKTATPSAREAEEEEEEEEEYSAPDYENLN